MISLYSRSKLFVIILLVLSCASACKAKISKSDPLTINSISPTSGSYEGGTKVTISGKTMDDVTQVKFDGEICTSLEIVSEKKLTCLTPAHAAGEVDVVLYSATFNPLTLKDGFLYTGEADVAPTLTSIAPTEGVIAGGDAVALTGTGFETGATVQFDGVDATNVVVVSNSSITCDTPAHAAGVVDVTVENANTLNDTLAASFTYVTLPTIASVNPTSGSASGGLGVTISGTNLTGTTAVTFDGVAATSVNVVNATTVTAVTLAHAAGAVDVEITTASGSDSLVSGFTYLVTAVGQSAFGGVIASLGGGLDDIIAATADNSTGIEWGDVGLATSATSTMDGATNTATILGVVTVFPNAASICNDYEIDSLGNTPCEVGNTCYNSWFLPAQNQLNSLFVNRVAIGGFWLSYFSSTEVDANQASVQEFVTGSMGAGIKNALDKVRCVAAFTP